MDRSTAALLQELVRRESLSLLSYVGDAFPWTASGGDVALAQLRQVVDGHKKAVADLLKALTHKRLAPPFIGSFPSGFTSINFLAFSYVVPRLIDSERKSLALLEAEVPLVTDPDLRAAVEQFLAAKRDHLSRLEAMPAGAPSTVVSQAAS